MQNGSLRVLLVEDDHVLLNDQLARIERQKYQLEAIEAGRPITW
jgi:hypothetical protein